VPDPLLDVRDLYAGYGSLIVVRGVSFSVDEGTTTLILGLNGAGKTTTLKAIAGIVRPVRGSIIFNRKNDNWLAPSRKGEGGHSHDH